MEESLGLVLPIEMYYVQYCIVCMFTYSTLTWKYGNAERTPFKLVKFSD